MKSFSDTARCCQQNQPWPHGDKSDCHVTVKYVYITSYELADQLIYNWECHHSIPELQHTKYS